MTLLSIEKEILHEIDYNKLINDFASQKPKKLILNKIWIILLNILLV